MDEQRRRFAARLYEHSRGHDQGVADRLERFRNVEPPSAELLGVLIRAVGARRILVELRVGDAGRLLGECGDGEWEFVFVDAERPAYAGYVGDLVRVLAPGGVLAVDNVLSHEHELMEFTGVIEAVAGLTQTVVPVGAGLRLAVRDPGSTRAPSGV